MQGNRSSVWLNGHSSDSFLKLGCLLHHVRLHILSDFIDSKLISPTTNFCDENLAFILFSHNAMYLNYYYLGDEVYCAGSIEDISRFSVSNNRSPPTIRPLKSSSKVYVESILSFI